MIPDRTMGIICKINLVANHHQRNVWQIGTIRQALINFCYILNPEYRIGIIQSLPRAADSLGFYRVWDFPDSSGVDKLDGQTIDIDPLSKYVSGSTGILGHNGSILPTQKIQQARFSNIGFADNDELKAVPQQAASPCLFQQFVKCLRAKIDPFFKCSVGQKINIFLRKVDRRLNVQAQAYKVF